MKVPYNNVMEKDMTFLKGSRYGSLSEGGDKNLDTVGITFGITLQLMFQDMLQIILYIWMLVPERSPFLRFSLE